MRVSHGGDESIVVTTGQDPDFVVCDLVDQTVFIINPLGPTSGKLVFERLRFDYAAEGIGSRFLDQPEDWSAFLRSC